jgi:phosphoribosyl-ATP pyrophosphohydrolase
MNRPDFQKQEIYSYQLTDSAGNILHEGEMNEKAWNKTIENKTLWEWIRTNGRVIEKETAGLLIDTDHAQIRDKQILLTALKKDAGGNRRGHNILQELEAAIRKRKEEMPPNSYTTHLFEKGEEKILKKLGEEAVELILASSKNRSEIVGESSDLIYHLMVLLVYKNIPFEEILRELEERHSR